MEQITKDKRFSLSPLLFVFAAITLSSCAAARGNDFSQYNFSLKDTLAIFLLNNEKDYYFCIPIQYTGDYQVSGFEFDNGNILIGDYDILLKRDEVKISVYLNEEADEGLMNHYIFIEKNLTDDEMKNIINEYEKRRVYSRMSVWYDITIDNEKQNGSGMLDDFELYNGLALDSALFPENLNFFKAKYLE
jgi:hypothetical protein